MMTETENIDEKDGNFIVTPWHVQGDIDYDKLIKQFGTQKLDASILNRIKKTTGQDHFMLRRGIFFSHRDMSNILDEYEKGNKFFLYTGRGPSGHTHIGHLVPWVFAKWLQDRFDVNMYFQLTDDEKFFSKPNLKLDEATKFAYENALDFIALGFDPKNTKIIIDTKNIRTLYPIAAKIAKKINFSNTKAVFGFTNETNIGMIFYTSLQSAPCFIEKDRSVLIPLGVDQDPHFRLTRDVAPRIGMPKPALIHNVMIPSLQGPGGKMSASDENGTIYTTDLPNVVKKKINKYAFSGGQSDIKKHREVGGDPDIDVSYQYLRIFFEPDDKKLKNIYDDYKSGKMLSGELKMILIEKINSFLEIHQQKRQKAKDHIHEFLFEDK
jgi:tryptophanyl-tRNA synthetase